MRSQGYLQERNPQWQFGLWSSATLQSRSLFLELCLVDLGILTCPRRCPSPGKLRFRASFYYGFPLKTPRGSPSVSVLARPNRYSRITTRNSQAFCSLSRSLLLNTSLLWKTTQLYVQTPKNMLNKI